MCPRVEEDGLGWGEVGGHAVVCRKAVLLLWCNRQEGERQEERRGVRYCCITLLMEEVTIRFVKYCI